MVLFLARCWLYKLLQKKVLPTHQRAFFYADWYYRRFGFESKDAVLIYLGWKWGIEARVGVEGYRQCVL